MAKKLSPALMTLLSAIVAGAATADGFIFAPKSDIDKLLAARPGSVEYNATVTDPTNAANVAVRPTAIGTKEIEDAKVKAESKVADTAVASTLEILDNVPKPEKVRGGNLRGGMYPFDKMNIGQAFFIADTVAKPDAAKSIASTIGSANKRFAKAAPVGTAFKVFGVYRGVSPKDATVKGALVFRESDVTMTTELRAKIDAPKTPKVATPAATGATA